MVLFSLLMVLICLNACSGAKISDNVTVYVTTNDRAKDFVRSEIALGDKQAASPCVITIDPSVRYQTMDGFGAAVTGSTCYNLMRMAPEDRTAFLKETFSDTEGMGYSYIRISIGCSDFSLSEYTCCDTKGVENFALQSEEKGTGQAVMMAKDEMEGYDGDELIVYGDMPQFKEETYKAICKKHKESGAALTLLTADIKNPPAYGRIIRDENGSVKDIVEEKDCTDEQKRITELNVGVYVADAKLMFETLKGLKNHNAQGEYYLTDLPKMLIAEGRKVESYTTYDAEEIVGVNTPEELAFCEKVLAERK